jgi:hypothetical protein
MALPLHRRQDGGRPLAKVPLKQPRLQRRHLARRGGAQLVQLLAQLSTKAAQLAQRQVLGEGGRGGGGAGGQGGGWWWEEEGGGRR